MSSSALRSSAGDLMTRVMFRVIFWLRFVITRLYKYLFVVFFLDAILFFIFEISSVICFLIFVIPRLTTNKIKRHMQLAVKLYQSTAVEVVEPIYATPQLSLQRRFSANATLAACAKKGLFIFLWSVYGHLSFISSFTAVSPYHLLRFAISLWSNWIPSKNKRKNHTANIRTYDELNASNFVCYYKFVIYFFSPIFFSLSHFHLTIFCCFHQQ